jgi:hypothetical protein
MPRSKESRELRGVSVRDFVDVSIDASNLRYMRLQYHGLDSIVRSKWHFMEEIV